MKFKASDNLDSRIKEDIIKSIMILRKSGFTDDQIFTQLTRDFQVSITVIKEIAEELKKSS